MILALRTDKPEAEVYLYDSSGKGISRHIWHAHRELSVTLLVVIRDQLHARQVDFAAIHGVIVFCGPGSFTGLRIGVAVANALAYGLGVPVVGTNGEQWQSKGLRRLAKGDNDRIVLPEYGAEAHITVQRK